MKLRITCLFALACLFSFNGKMQAATLSGTYSIPGNVAGTTVNNLSQLATLLNASTVSGSVIFEFSSAYKHCGNLSNCF